MREKNHYFELFGMPSGVDCKITRQVTSGSYQDSGGKVITADEDHFFEIFVIENCNSDTILLEPFYSRWYDAPKPFIVLTIK